MHQIGGMLRLLGAAFALLCAQAAFAQLPPVAVNDSFSTAEDTPLNVAAPGVLANDTDPDSVTLTAVLETNVASGTLSLNANGSFTYAPAANFNGNVSFTYRASDGTTTSAPATVSIAVTAGNDPPAAANDSYTTAEDTPLNIAAPGVLANDTDPDGGALTAVLETNVASGTLSLNANGSFTYTPAANFNGNVSFTYRANDGTVTSAPATVSITVTAGNDPPAAANDSYTTAEDTPLNIAAPGVLANDTDPDGGALTAVLETNVASGTLSLNANGSFTYTPNANFNGNDSFTYRANDGTVPSDARDRVDQRHRGATIRRQPRTTATRRAEDTPLTVPRPASSQRHRSDGDALTAVAGRRTANGTLTLNANGSFTYTPNANFNGTDSFTYRASDGTADRARRDRRRSP